MKRNLFRGFIVFLFTVALGSAAKAQEPDRLVVNIPYGFVVNGKALPAGKYDVKRVDDSNLRVLSLSGRANRVYVVTLSSSFTDTTDSRPGVTFLQDGDQKILIKIQTGEHVFSIPVAAADSALSKSDIR